MTHIDVDRLAEALRRWEQSADPEAEDVGAELGVAIYENGEREVAEAIAREYPTTGLNADWLTRELIAYFQIYASPEVWREREARHLAEWLSVRSAAR